LKFWDGFEQTRRLRIPTTTKIDLFLEICRRSFMNDYPDLRTIKGEFGLLFVLDGIIMPTTITFYDLLKNNIKGKSGPLF
jgi:XAP5, circadian clock regulator